MPYTPPNRLIQLAEDFAEITGFPLLIITDNDPQNTKLITAEEYVASMREKGNIIAETSMIIVTGPIQWVDIRYFDEFAQPHEVTVKAIKGKL